MAIAPAVAVSDEYYEPIHFKCEGHRIKIWAQELWNDTGRNFRYFDKDLEGAYDPNALVKKGAADRIVRKQCQSGVDRVFDVAIAPGRACQGQIVPDVEIQWNSKTIFRAREFGSNCSNVKAPYFVEADATSRSITVGYVEGQPSDHSGKPIRFTFRFPESGR